MKKEFHLSILSILFPILGIMVGELNMFYSKFFIGLEIYILTLLGIIFMIIYFPLDIKIKNILQSLTLVILLRIIDLSIPRFFTIPINQFSLIYAIMLIPIYSTIKNQQISAKDLGIDFRRFYIYFPISLIIGILFAISEYKILNPIILIDKIKFSDIMLITIIMFLFIGFVEELIFRSIIQTRFEKVLGLNYSILLSGIIFGMVHSSYGILGEVLLSSIFGIILGYIFYKTRSLPFIVSIHGSANIILYSALPNLA